MNKTFYRAFHYLKKRKWHFALGIVSLLIVDILQLFIPRVVEIIINDLTILKGDRIFRLFLYIVFISAGMALFRFFWRQLIVRSSFYIEEQLRNELYEHYLALDQTFFDLQPTGSLISYATNDLQAVRMLFSMGVIGACDGIFLTILSIVFMLSMSVKLTLMILMPLPVITVFILAFGKRIYERFTRVQESFSKLTSSVQQFIVGIRLSKNFVLEEYTTQKVEAHSKEIFHSNMSLVRVWGLMFPLMIFITGLSSALVVLLGGRLTVLNELSLGEFVAYSSYIGILSWPMMAIGWVMNLFERGKASMMRINEVLDRKSKICDGTKELKEKESPLLQIKDVSFAYETDSKLVLNEIAFALKKGEKIGITGKTGSGKSSLVKLISRSYDPTSGHIEFMGSDIKTLPLKKYREQIAVVPQHTTLFSETIAENIGFSLDEIDMEQVVASAQGAALSDSIDNFPDRYETIVGERGVTLSGGQKQRTAIARALLKTSSLIIFDDSFSAVDSKTEESILSHIMNIDVSMIVVSHRISTVARCDRVLVVDEGRIVEEGSHSQLLASDGLYALMNARQRIEGSLHHEV